MPYQDNTLYISQFIIEGLDDYDEPLMIACSSRKSCYQRPKFGGKQAAVQVIYIAASNLKYCFADFSIS
jgi:hypothetical protein